MGVILVILGSTTGKGAKGRGDLKILNLTLDIRALQLKSKKKIIKKQKVLSILNASFLRSFIVWGKSN